MNGVDRDSARQQTGWLSLGMFALRDSIEPVGRLVVCGPLDALTRMFADDTSGLHDRGTD